MIPIEIRQPEWDELLSKNFSEGAGLRGYRPRGLFYTKIKTGWLACDNLEGEAWTEEFKTKKEALQWLESEEA